MVSTCLILAHVLIESYHIHEILFGVAEFRQCFEYKVARVDRQHSIYKSSAPAINLM